LAGAAGRRTGRPLATTGDSGRIGASPALHRLGMRYRGDSNTYTIVSMNVSSLLPLLFSRMGLRLRLRLPPGLRGESGGVPH
jgi:hypothetical protein